MVEEYQANTIIWTVFKPLVAVELMQKNDVLLGFEKHKGSTAKVLCDKDAEF